MFQIFFNAPRVLGIVSINRLELTFTKDGLYNWNDIVSSLKRHQEFILHKERLERFKRECSSSVSINASLDKQLRDGRVANNEQLVYVIKALVSRPTKQLDEGTSASVKLNEQQLSRKIYFVAIDLVSTAIQDRFNQKGMLIYSQLESLLTGVRSSNDLCVVKDIADLYSYNVTNLQNELKLLNSDTESFQHYYLH